jgi:Family of unknown function (DUF6278)
VVFGVLRPEAAHLDELLGQCDQLRIFAQAHGFELDRDPDDIGLLDQAFDQGIDLAHSELGGPLRIADLANQAGLYLGTVMTATLPGRRWRLWPNGHPVVCLPSGRDLDVVALANNRVSKGLPRLTSIYASAAEDRSS